MALDPSSRARFNLENACVLLLDDTSIGMSILTQMVKGFGATRLFRCDSVEQASRIAQEQQLDLAIVDSGAGGQGFDFVRWMRTNCNEPNCFTPVLITTAHTPVAHIARARDCGSHITVKKPFSPLVLLERIIWVAKEGRPFLFTDRYTGPDRRFQEKEPPKGKARRQDDADSRLTLLDEPPTPRKAAS